MEEKIESCIECLQCLSEKEKERKNQEANRVKILIDLYDIFKEKNAELYGNDLYMNVDLLQLSVVSYYDDIYRFKDYSGSHKADRHKQAAYTIKWISKIKPIQVVKGVELTKSHIFVNASFSLFAGFAFLDKRVGAALSEHYIKHLLYTCLYRNISGRQLASTMYVIEQFATKQNMI
jgi:hypothetical protein